MKKRVQEKKTSNDDIRAKGGAANNIHLVRRKIEDILTDRAREKLLKL